jgi:transcription antitermination protein NusB
MNRKQTCSPEACAIACVSPDELPDNPIWAGDRREDIKTPPMQQVESCSTENAENESADDTADESYEQVGPGRKRRSLMFHILYALDAHNYEASIASIIDIFNRGFEQTIEVDGQEQKSCEAIIASREEIDEFLKPLLSNWRLERVGVCTRLILRIAVWELLHTETDPRVVLNEAIELAKCFAERDAYRFVNGVLDEALKRLGKQPVEETTEQKSDPESAT